VTPDNGMCRSDMPCCAMRCTRWPAERITTMSSPQASATAARTRPQSSRAWLHWCDVEEGAVHPLLPEFVDANTATGQFVVERDRYVDG
jgi:hypothetical protein